MAQIPRECDLSCFCIDSRLCHSIESIVQENEYAMQGCAKTQRLIWQCGNEKLNGKRNEMDGARYISDAKSFSYPRFNVRYTNFLKELRSYSTRYKIPS